MQSALSPSDVGTPPANAQYLFIGNPGVGKSTIMNCFAGRRLFKSGVSPDSHGVTYQPDVAKHRGVTFYDTPGLSDIKRRKDAAEAITTFLQQGGTFRIVFTMSLSAGRLTPDDLTTMKLVLDASKGQIGADSFGIVINKCSKQFLEKFDHDGWVRNCHEACQERGIACTQHMHFAPLIEDLDEEEDVLVPLHVNTQKFLSSVPCIHLENCNVGVVMSRSFEDLVQGVDEQVDKVQQEVEAQKKAAEREKLEAQEAARQARAQKVARERAAQEAEARRLANEKTAREARARREASERAAREMKARLAAERRAAELEQERRDAERRAEREAEARREAIARATREREARERERREEFRRARRRCRAEFKVGDHVRAKYPNGIYYPATVARLCSRNTMLLNWDDGDTLHRVVSFSDAELEYSDLDSDSDFD